MSSPNLFRYLQRMLELEASDLYLTVGMPPVYRVEGTATPDAQEPEFSSEDTLTLANMTMNDGQRTEFFDKKEMNLALALAGIGRFRCNIFQQRGTIGMVVRQIKEKVPSVESLGLPPVLNQIIESKRGLVLVVGSTGSGKSTTLAAMIDWRNSMVPGHIVTIEDPIEFMHPHKRCIITQREVGFDTLSFHEALRNTLRQAPDVILIGEIRDSETMEAAITFAETGHLCITTLHSNNANQAIERIMNFFPSNRHSQIYLQLSLNLRSIISQRLVPGVDGMRVAALEVLMDTPRVQDLIKKGEIDTLKEAMEMGEQEGCQTFDRALYLLHVEGKITLEEALANADSANNLRIRIRNSDFKQAAAPAEGTPTFRIEGKREPPPFAVRKL